VIEYYATGGLPMTRRQLEDLVQLLAERTTEPSVVTYASFTGVLWSGGLFAIKPGVDGQEPVIIEQTLDDLHNFYITNPEKIAK
jgi:hypothetical protein